MDGAVAQLGERVVRNDEVRGSIPLGSTININNVGVFALSYGISPLYPHLNLIKLCGFLPPMISGSLCN